MHWMGRRQKKKRLITHHILYFALQLQPALFSVCASPFHPFLTCTPRIESLNSANVYIAPMAPTAAIRI